MQVSRIEPHNKRIIESIESPNWWHGCMNVSRGRKRRRFPAGMQGKCLNFKRRILAAVGVGAHFLNIPPLFSFFACSLPSGIAPHLFPTAPCVTRAALTLSALPWACAELLQNSEAVFNCTTTSNCGLSRREERDVPVSRVLGKTRGRSCRWAFPSPYSSPKRGENVSSVLPPAMAGDPPGSAGAEVWGAEKWAGGGGVTVFLQPLRLRHS